MGGQRRELPSPSRELIEKALVSLDGGPVTVGPLAFRVCDLLEVDTEGVSGSYDLRSRLSWSGLRTELKHMEAAGLVVARTRREWHDMTHGALFPDVGQGANRAYALTSVAGSSEAALKRKARGKGDARRKQALQRAQARVLVEQWATVERYMRELLAADPGEGER